MKKMKRLVAVLLAGVMVLAMLTACGGTGNDAATAKFEAKVEQAYMAELNKVLREKFKNDEEFENNADIKKLAVEHIGNMAGKETLNKDELWTKKEDPTAKTQDWVMICYDSTEKGFVKSYYEADKAETITLDEATITKFLALARIKAHAGNTAKFTALGVGTKTIDGKTYVAIGVRVEG